MSEGQKKTLPELQESDIIRVMREEWNARLKALAEEVDLTLDMPGVDTDSVISPELKVHHKNSGIRYTVSSVGPRDVILRTPEGEDFIVGADEFEADYQLGQKKSPDKKNKKNKKK